MRHSSAQPNWLVATKAGAISGVRLPVGFDAFIPALQARDDGTGETQDYALGRGIPAHWALETRDLL